MAERSFEEQMLGPVKLDPSAIVKNLEDIQKANVEVNEEIKKAAEEQAKILEDVLEILRNNRRDDKKASAPRKNSKKAKAADQALYDALQKMQKQNKSFSENVQKALKDSNNAVTNMTSDVAAKLRTSSGGKNMPGTQTKKKGGNRQGPVDYEFDDSQFAIATNLFLADVFASIATGLAGGVQILEEITSGIPDDMKFYKQMKIVAYQTKGITENTREMQDNFIQVGKSVERTGYGVTTFQQALLQNVKKGVKEAGEITRTGLNLGKMLGMGEEGASQMSATFGKWKGQLKLSSNQLADISRGIQEVNKYTGITGENMQDIVQASEQFMKRMESAGNLTATSAKNMIHLQAAASKLGVADEMSELNKGISNSADLLLKMGGESQAMLLVAAGNAGRLEDVMQGTLASTKQGLKDLAGGYEQLFENISGGVSFEDIDKLDTATKSQINLVLESAFGVGIEDFKKIAEATAEAGKTYNDRLGDINKKLNDNITGEEKIALLRQKQELQLTKAFEFSSALAEHSKDQSIKTVDEAIHEMQRKAGAGWNDVVEDLAHLSKDLAPELANKIKAGDTGAIAKAIAISSAKALKEGGGQDYTKKLLSAIKKNDLVEFRRLQQTMTEEQQKLGIKTITKLDPMEEMAQEVHLLNEQFRSFLSPALNSLLSLVGGQALMIAELGLMATSMMFSARAGGTLYDMLNMLKKIPGLGKTAAVAGTVAPAAANVAGAVAPLGGQAAKTAITAGATTAAGAAMAGTASAATGTAAGGAAAGGAAAGAGGAATTGIVATASAWAWPVAAALAAILGTIGAIVGNLKAGAAAADIFNVAQEDLTLSQYYSAKAAGTLTGALNFLTFGIFNKWLGTTGVVTKALAKLNEKIPILTAVAAVIDVVMGYLWGTLKSTFHIIAGYFEMFYLALEPVGELLSAVMEVVFALFSPLTKFDEKLSETGGLFTIVSETIEGMGYAVRWLMRIIGKVIGFLVKVVLKPFVIVIKALAKGIESLLKPLGDVFDGIMTFAMGIMKVVQGIFTFNFKTIWEGLKRMAIGAIQAVGAALFGFIMSIPEAIVDMVGSILTGIGTLFDEIEGPIGGLLQLIVFPFKVLGKLLEAIGDTIGGLYDMMMGIFSFDGDRFGTGLWNVLSSIPAALGNLVLDMLGIIFDTVISLPVWLFNRFKDVFFDLPRWLMRSLIDGLQSLAVELPKQLWNSFMTTLGDLSANEWIGPIFEPFLEIFKPLSEAMNELFTAFDEMFDAIGEAFAPINDLLIDLGIFSGEGSIFKDVVHLMAQIIGEFIRSALVPLKETIEWLVPLIKGWAESIKSWAEAFQAAAKQTNDAMNAVMNPLKSLFEWMESKLSWITKWFGKKKDAEKKEPEKKINTSVPVLPSPAPMRSRLDETTSAKAPEAVLAKSLREQELKREAANNVLKTTIEKEQVQVTQQPLLPSALRTAAGINDVTPVAEPAVKPQSLQTVHQKMQQQHSTTGKEGSRANIPEFAKIISISEEQLHYMMLLYGEMKKVTNLLTPSNRSGMSDAQKMASTASNIKPTNSPNYNSWQFGRYQQNPSKQVITTGTV